MIKRLLAAGAWVAASGLPVACRGSCFVAGTRITTPRGPRRIEELRVGDEVWSWRLGANEPVARPVASVLRSAASETVRIAAGEATIEGVTEEHPFWDVRRGTWVPAADLSLSGTVLAWHPGAVSSEHPMTRIERVVHGTHVPVYNLSVDGDERCFFAEGVLVHNKESTSCQTVEGCIPGEICVVVCDNCVGWMECRACNDAAQCVAQYGPGWVCRSGGCVDLGADAAHDAADGSGDGGSVGDATRDGSADTPGDESADGSGA